MKERKMHKLVKCKRCKNPFYSNILIKDDDVCRTCDRLNDITFWYPVLLRIGIPVPKTIILHTNVNMEQLAMDEMPEGLTEFIGELRIAIDKIGWPAFLRTGYTSNKHDWKESCFVDRNANLLHHVKNLAEFSSLMTIDRFTPCDFWAIREFIEAETFFTSFSGEMPITKERRLFVKNGKVLCSHSYWDVEELFKDISKEKVKELNNFADEDKKTMVQMATYVSKHFSGEWSVDFLKGKNGNWYITDMAIGERSYHQKHKTT